jgi:hypothetical protein
MLLNAALILALHVECGGLAAASKRNRSTIDEVLIAEPRAACPEP